MNDKTPNKLINETSPYLLQHAYNPVDWYPWGEEAFKKAKAEDKPVFLSIGYSTCHWCHVMAHESFEDDEIADILNRYFVAIKVDKEERPDIDSVYMSVCQAFTGGGGWPTSIFMTAAQKPFFAGTYFPKTSRRGMTGFKELLLAVHDKWEQDRASLLRSAGEATAALRQSSVASAPAGNDIIETALSLYRQSFDSKYGGVGSAPKFPAPHNLLFLLQQYEKNGDAEALRMAELTLKQMYRGGIFDHIGYGFCRYSTDRFYLVPHFEKMLYDNALLILAYCKAYELTGNALYRRVAENTAAYLLREMRSPEGGFYSAQDADSDGEEGRYYVFTPEEISGVLGNEDGAAFNAHFGVSPEGNFEGKSIPNLLNSDTGTSRFDDLLPKLRDYRRKRARLHTDDKVLTLWNSLCIAALCALYRISREATYLDAAKQAQRFIESELCQGDVLYVSFREGKRSGKGFLDDYAAYAFALLALYGATLDTVFLERARQMSHKAIFDFFDADNGGFYLYGRENETLVLRPKESYDGAIPSGNSLMAYVLVRLSYLAPDEEMSASLQKQLVFLSGEAARYPSGYALFLMALSDFREPPVLITVVGRGEELTELPFIVPSGGIVRVLPEGTPEYKRMNDKPTYYICRGHSCLPPVHELTKELIHP